MYNKISIGAFLLIFLVGCIDTVDNSVSSLGSNSSGWLIPSSRVQDGGPGPDGIPSLDAPKFKSADSADDIGDEQLVVGIKIGDVVKAYPHNILDWHEIVNDRFDLPDSQQHTTLSYCPLTGSAMAWDAFADSSNKTFGVSGLLYNSNLILYDRETRSLWSQMLEQSVNGDVIGTIPDKRQIIETTWATWKAMYPDTLVLSRDTGFSRDYDRYPYGSFKTDDSIFFQVANRDSRLHEKERIVGVRVDDKTKVYPVHEFPEHTEAVNDEVDDVSIVAVGNSEKNFAVIYNRQLADGTVLEFSGVSDSLPVVMEDNEGNQWDIFGTAVSGSRAGEQLAKTDSYIAYWFAWAAFFPEAEIY